MWQLLIVFYWIILLTASIIGLIRWKIMDKPSRIMVRYIAVTCLFEGIAILASHYYKNNHPVYHIYAPIQLFIISMYFNNSVTRLKKNNIGLYIGCAGIIAGIVNAVFFQHPVKAMNTYFLVLSAFLVISMALTAFYEILTDDKTFQLTRYTHFWFSTFFLIFWTFTFFYWLIGLTLNIAIVWFGVFLWIVNMIIDIGFAIIFLYYRKFSIR